MYFFFEQANFVVHLRMVFMEVTCFAFYSAKLKPRDANLCFVNGRCHHWRLSLSEWTMRYLLKFSPRQGETGYNSLVWATLSLIFKKVKFYN